MNRSTVFSFAAALTLLCALPQAGARTFEQIKASGTLRVASAGTMPPFILVDGSRHQGYEPELLENVARTLGLKVTYQVVPPYELVKMLQEDRVDVAIGAMGITSTRENKVDFTMPIACAAVSVISYDPKLSKHTDLVGKTIGVSAGSIMQSYVQKLPFEKKVNVYATVQELIYAVISRNVDATFGYTIMEPSIKSIYPKANLSFGPVLWRVQVGMMVREDNTSTKKVLDEAIGKFMKTNSYAFLSQKYFKEDVRCR